VQEHACCVVHKDRQQIVICMAAGVCRVGQAGRVMQLWVVCLCDTADRDYGCMFNVHAGAADRASAVS
jgi:hypothetical protein